MAKFKAKNIDINDASSESNLNIEGSEMDHEALQILADAANSNSEFEAEESIKIEDAHEAKNVTVKDSKIKSKAVWIITAVGAALAAIAAYYFSN